MKTLLAGPWIGEFGWELFGWQGCIRILAKKYDEVIVIGRTGHDFLYGDFADIYIDFDPKGWECSGSNCFDQKT